MNQYLTLLKHVLHNGADKADRTGTGTKSLFGYQMRFDLTKGFPLLTTKKVHFASVVHELIWFLSGSTNIEYLVKNNVRIWNEWPFKKYQKSSAYGGESLKEFAEKIKTDHKFALEWGDLGDVYGKQWRDFNGHDQIKNLITEIKKNPLSRRLIVSSWNPSSLGDMLLPPCHLLFQFYVNNNEISCQLYQRSADIFLGVPFNIASYSLLTLMIAQVCGLKPKKFVHTLGDAHLYYNHIKQAKLQLQRAPKRLPQIKLNPQIKSIFDFEFNDIELVDYEPWPSIKAQVAI